MLNILSYDQPQPLEGALNVWPYQFDRNPDLVQAMLEHRAGFAAKISARKLQIITPTPAEARSFLEANHLNGGTAHTSFRYGLATEKELLIVITLGKPRYTTSFDFEVLRMATKAGVVVQGGASKLFAHIRAQHPEAALLSYSDRLHGTGDVYRIAGFEHLGVTKPGYFWEKNGTVLQRHRTQKHLLPQLLGDVDLTLSEAALMQNAGWRKQFDLGHHRWGLYGVDSKRAEHERKHHFTYRTTRPTIDDAFYYGVHSTDDLEDGYCGSGQVLSASLLTYGKHLHHCEVLTMFSTRKEALDEEARLVTIDVLADPRCMNIALGGGSMLLPAGTTTGRFFIHHETGKEQMILEAWWPTFERAGWKRGRHPTNIRGIVGKWYRLPDGTHGRGDGEWPENAVPGKQASTTGRTWVERDGRKRLVTQVLEGDVIGFTPANSTKGKIVLVLNGERKLFDPAEELTKRAEGWTDPTPPTQGRIGMRSPSGQKRLVSPIEARVLVKEGWTLATTQLKSAPPQVLELAAELGMKLPKRRKQA